jgi:hypothetical protein
MFCRHHSVLLVFLALILLVVPVHGVLWLRDGFNHSAHELATCNPAMCIFNYTQDASNVSSINNGHRTKPEEFAWGACAAEVKNRSTNTTEMVGIGAAFKCRCLTDVYSCLTEPNLGNCSKRLARQYCWDFWASRSDTIGCSWRLCLSAGGYSATVIIAGLSSLLLLVLL